MRWRLRDKRCGGAIWERRNGRNLFHQFLSFTNGNVLKKLMDARSSQKRTHVPWEDLNAGHFFACLAMKPKLSSDQ